MRTVAIRNIAVLSLLSFVTMFAWASDHSPSLKFIIKNYTPYPLTYGYSQTKNYNGIGPNPQYGIVPAGEGTVPGATPIITAMEYFHYHHSAFHRTCEGSNWRFMIYSGFNGATFNFVAEVPCSGSSNWVAVSGSGTQLAPPSDITLNNDNLKTRIILCGNSSKYGVADKSSAYGDGTYTITAYMYSQMKTCPA